MTDEYVLVPKKWVEDWCDHAMTILTEWKRDRNEQELDDQITQLAMDIKEYMVQQGIWNVWYDENTPISQMN